MYRACSACVGAEGATHPPVAWLQVLARAVQDLQDRALRAYTRVFLQRGEALASRAAAVTASHVGPLCGGVAALRAQLADVEAENAACNAEVARLEAQAEEVCAQQAALHAQVRAQAEEMEALRNALAGERRVRAQLLARGVVISVLTRVGAVVCGSVLGSSCSGAVPGACACAHGGFVGRSGMCDTSRAQLRCVACVPPAHTVQVLSGPLTCSLTTPSSRADGVRRPAPALAATAAGRALRCGDGLRCGARFSHRHQGPQLPRQLPQGQMRIATLWFVAARTSSREVGCSVSQLMRSL